MKGLTYANNRNDAIASSLSSVEDSYALVSLEFLCTGRHDSSLVVLEEYWLFRKFALRFLYEQINILNIREYFVARRDSLRNSDRTPRQIGVWWIRPGN
jgi:hypothetical protein